MILMTPASTKLVPVGGKITLFVRHVFVGAVVVDRGSLVEDADVRMPGIDPVDKFLVVVGLAGPHSVLDVPVEHPQCFLVFGFPGGFFGLGGCACREQDGKGQDDGKNDVFDGIVHCSHNVASFCTKLYKIAGECRLRQKLGNVRWFREVFSD